MTERPSIFPRPLPFIDLQAQRRIIADRVEAAIARVLAHGQFVLGPEVAALEAELARFCGAQEVVSCANGTDALALVLMAKGVKPGDAILCPSFTFAATAEVVVWLGAVPVFVDVKADTFNLDSHSLELGIATARRLGLKAVGIIPVDLFGQPADYAAIEPLCVQHGLWMLADAAQSFGASYQGRKVGTMGVATATSFFPAKPLGCYGDGGAVFTTDPDLAKLLRSLRVHGQGNDRYDNPRVGLNSRLDTIQAAILIEKLRIFPEEIRRRNEVAQRYNAGLANVAEVPRVLADCVSTWAQYTIRVARGRRADLAAALNAQGIPTAIYYPKPLHQQLAYHHYPVAGNGLAVTETIAHEVISLPMHPYLEPDVQDQIISAVCAVL
jgi:dTDP-4-amino-4,6-dideoxygalactose transaminase